MRSLCVVLLSIILPGAAGASPPEVLVVVDCSGSMREQVPVGPAQKNINVPGGTVVFKGTPTGKTESRIDAAKRALASVIDQIPASTKLGVRLFAHRYGGRSNAEKRKSCEDTELMFPIAPPDRPAMKTLVANITCKGWTPLAYSLDQAGKDFANTADVERTIVVLSDGEETCGGDPAAVARRLHESGLKIVTDVIGFSVDAQARAQLQQVAAAGGGKYFGADDAVTLARSLAVAVKASVAPPPEPTPKPSAPDPRPSVGAPPAETVAFADEFDGVKLGPAWERQNPDDERFLLEGGKIILITRAPAKMEEQLGWFNTLVNRTALPADFEAALEFEAEPSQAQFLELRAVQGDRFVSTHFAWDTSYATQSYFTVTKGSGKDVSPVKGESAHTWASVLKQSGRARGLLGLHKVGREWQGYIRVGENELRFTQNILGLKPTEMLITVGHSQLGKYPEKEVHLHRFEIKELKP